LKQLDKKKLTVIAKLSSLGKPGLTGGCEVFPTFFALGTIPVNV
jgi:hypothetical protein